MKRLAVLIASTAFALALATPAFAEQFFSHGVISATQPWDASCVWYYANKGEACSGWNYWTGTYEQKEYPDIAIGGRVNVGFQNVNVIRGAIWNVATTVWVSVSTSDVGMGGYLVAHGLYWDSGTSYVAFANAG